MADLTRLKKSRTAHRNVTKKLFTKFETANFTTLTNTQRLEVTDELNSTISTLQNKQEILKTLDEKILAEIEEEEELENELENATEYELILQKHLARLKRLEKSLQEPPKAIITTGSTYFHERKTDTQGVRLPKLEIPKFQGDPLLWNSFKDTFTATIHSNKKLSNIEKYTYLQSYVSGEAQQAINGLPLTNENYDKAWNLLDERYGNPQLVRSSHMNKLIKLEKAANGSARELRKLYDTIESNVRALKSTGIDKDTLGPLLIPIVLEKLPNVVRLHLSRKLGSGNWDINEFLKEINEEIQARENFDFLKETELEKQKTKASSISSLTMGASLKQKVCRFCQSEDHYSDQCSIVTNQNARREILKKNHCCFNCLKPGHLKKDCSVVVKCFKCGMQGNHPTALCTNNNKTSSTKINEKSIEKTTNLVDDSNTVLLQTANAIAFSSSNARGVRLLFDLGSQQTYITEKLVSDLNLKPIREVNMGVKTFGTKKEKTSHVKEYELNLKGESDAKIKAFAVPYICAPINGQDISAVLSKHPHLREMVLAENEKDIEKHVDILIGADFYWDLVTGQIRKETGGLTLIKSIFGYLMSGPIETDHCESSNTNFVSSHTLKIVCESRENQLLTEEVRNFWNLETIGINETEKSVYDKFQEEIEFKNGRYVVKLPFKESQSMLPDNYLLSEKRLKNLKTRLDKDGNLLKRYDDVFQEQKRAGIIEQINEGGEPGMVTYLPHREVLKEDRSTTKLRIVFDASAKQGNISLNDILYKGPCLNTQLFDLLLKFRIHPIGITADIEKAYYQISVDPQHRDFLRFLWYKDAFSENPEIQQFRFTRVIFGATSSSFLLNGVVRKIGDDYEKIDPEFSRKVREHFYVDDLNTGASDTNSGFEAYKKFKIRFGKANFNLRKWRTNNTALRTLIAVEERNNEEIIREINKQEIVDKINKNKENENIKKEEEATTGNENGKVLGIMWNEINDVLVLSMKEIFENGSAADTKRKMLQIIASVYDPIGFLQPLTLRLKLLFQEMCLLNLDWDSKVPENIQEKWRKLVNEMISISDIFVQRYYFAELRDPVESVYIHGFSDASNVAYGCCIYIKGVTKSGGVVVNLVTSKSRVVPSKQTLTIPRKELLGNFILAKLMRSVIGTLSKEIVINKYFCWTDSMITLSWIKATGQEFKTFVENRVIEIRKIISPELWSYCNTKENPADLITRSDNDVNSSLWWHGPHFLLNTNLETEHSSNVIEINGDSLAETLVEKKHTCLVNVQKESIGSIIDVNKYSCLQKLINVTSWIFRFIENLKRTKEKRILCSFVTVKEREKAKLFWIKENQSELIEGELKQLKRCLNVIPDNDNLLRCNDRIKNANLPYETKSPIIINRKHKLAELIVLDAHKRVQHLGARQTLAEVRTCYWLTRGRSFVKGIIAKCACPCRKLNSRHYQYPSEGDLPKIRLRDDTPFSGTGVDYFGPLYCGNVYVHDEIEEEQNKAYTALYTCATTRGVILDLVQDASATTFVSSLIRFVARRGCPKEIISDNGTQFTANETQRFASSRNIAWQFNLAEAPWYGGFFERLVQTVKRCLKKTIGNACLSFTELQTVLFETENIVNSRPLCEFDDPDLEEILTPNHLLFGRRLNLQNTGLSVTYSNDTIDLSKRTKYLQTIIEHFWNRWRKEYLVTLRQYRSTSKPRGPLIKENDIVLIYDDKQPRQSWRLGRVTELLGTRGAKVFVGRSKTEITRPVNKLYPVEYGYVEEKRTNRREAAVAADVKRRFCQRT